MSSRAGQRSRPSRPRRPAQDRRPRPSVPARSRPGPRPSGRPRKGPTRKPKISPLWAKLSVSLGALVLVISATIVGAPALLQALLFPDDVIGGPPLPDDIGGENIDGAINFLLLGMDNPDTPGQTDRRADSIVLVHVPATHDQIYMVSFPRDTRAEIPAFPTTGLNDDWTTKINSAFFAGSRMAGPGPDVWSRETDLSPEGRARGAELTMRTINNLVPGGLGLEFHGWATIDFDGFEAVVEALGGVHMCVDTELWSIHYYPDGTPSGDPLWRGLNNTDTAGGDYGDGYHYEVGCRDLEPWQALDYSRQRYGLPNSDYDRQRHQQQLLKAIVKKVASPDTLTNMQTVTSLREAAGDLLTLNLGRHGLADWAWTLRSLRADDIVMVRTNGGRLCNIPDSSDQCLLPETLDLLRAVKNDTMLDFLSTHRDWVATDQAPVTTTP